MADLTPLDEKLAEVLGLAKAAEGATEYVSKMDGADQFDADLKKMRDDAKETARRTDDLIGKLDGKKTAIREMAQETKTEADEMRKTYLADEEEALDGFEFLTMAEAAELGHWEIVHTMGTTIGADEVTELAEWAVDVQQGHFDGVRAASLVLAADEVQ